MEKSGITIKKGEIMSVEEVEFLITPPTGDNTNFHGIGFIDFFHLLKIKLCGRSWQFWIFNRNELNFDEFIYKITRRRKYKSNA